MQALHQPIGHEHVVWDEHSASGELYTHGFGDGTPRFGRTKRLARDGCCLAVPSADMKVAAKLHGPLPGFRQEME